MNATKIEVLPLDRAYQLFTCKRIGPERIQVDYELVMPLNEVDCRGTFDHKGRKARPVSHRLVWLDTANCFRIPLGRTEVGSSNAKYPFSVWDKPEDGLQIDLPFRDGAHCGWDNDKLGGLGMYYATETNFYQLIPAKKAELSGQ